MEIKTAILFIIASKRMKYLGIKLTKDMKGLYTKTNKTWIQDICKDLNKEKDIRVNELEDSLLLRCPFYLKPSADSTQSLLQFQPPFWTETAKEILKFRWELQGDPKGKRILKKKQKVGGLSFLTQACHKGAGMRQGSAGEDRDRDLWSPRKRTKGKQMVLGARDFCKGTRCAFNADHREEITSDTERPILEN